MKKIKIGLNVFFALSLLATGYLVSCRSDLDDLGKQFVEKDAAELKDIEYNVIAYNFYNKDGLRSDASQISRALLGTFHEAVFGTQKVSYVTQVRLSTYNPDFGIDPKIDSVVLQIKPFYSSDSVKANPNGTFSYPVLKYGNAKRKLTIKVSTIGEFLYSREKEYFSDHEVKDGILLGSNDFNGIVTSKKGDVKDVGIRVKLSNNNWFKDSIISKQGKPELQDAASFIRHLKGLKIGVEENDGYLFSFNPDEVTLKMYYKKGKEGDRSDAVYDFDLKEQNVHFSQIEYKREEGFDNAIKNIDTIKGDPKLYAQGTGGPGVEVKISKSTIDTLKKYYQKDKSAILSAKIRLYVDEETWKGNFKKPSNFILSRDSIEDFLSDFKAFGKLSGYRSINTENLDKKPAYYDFFITQTLNDIIQKESGNKDLTIKMDVGSFEVNSKSQLLGYQYTSRAYTPNRVVLIGSSAGEKSAKLIITSASKKK